jgi:Arc/MetJ family transcription regulator
MARKKTTVYIDEELLRQTKMAAARSGKHDYEVVEAALRRYLGLEVVDRVWARHAATPLDPDEALALAYEELRALRSERRARP